MTFAEGTKFLLLRSLGNFLVLLSLYGVAATFGPALYYEVQFHLIQFRGVHFNILNPAVKTQIASAEPTPTPQTDPSLSGILTGDKVQSLIPKDTAFDIVIPKIAANAKVYPNVDPSNPTEFLPILKEGVAHAKGTVFPGMQGNIYLFAHSTDNWWDVGRYNAVFYLLKDLELGDKIVIFYQNKEHDYVVSETYITDPTNVELITKGQNTREQLVLQTCWPPGTTWKRLFVIAQPQ